MDIVVKDANIIIDLLNIGLSQYCPLMELEFHITQHVFREIRDDTQRQQMIDMILKKELIVDDFTGEEYECFLEMVGSFDGVNNLSDADCSVIILAKRYNCRLLTSDRKLKRQAEEQGLRVNGLLWITDAMVEKGILTGPEMIPYLERYRKTNPRAPQNEINKRIEKYKE
jgi:predicted nucleic acid-binding protein